MSTFVLSGAARSAHPQIDYNRALNQEQLDVVLHGDGPCLVLAGAGSGKTRTLTYRVAYLLEQGVDPASILLLTFTNKASREMLSRVSGLLGQEAHGIWGGTFHSIANRILRSFAGSLGYTPSFSILDAEDARDLLKAILKDANLDPKARRFPSPAVLQDVISYARNVQRPLAEALEEKHPNFIGFQSEIEDIARQYQARKRSANVMDFDDLLTSLAQLLDDPVQGPLITERFAYVLVDEFQDTNALQARLVQGFARGHGNLLVVGDDAQSIYAFRGADVRNILSFPETWPGTKIFKLLTNYRSTPQILEVANASLIHNVEQFEKDLVAVCGAGEKPRLIPCASAAQEAEYIAEQILALRAEGSALRNISVLFRSGSHSQTLEFELIRRDIPYEYRGGQKFFERGHIKDVLAFLRVAHNPRDEVAWLRVLGLQAGIGAASATAIMTGLRAVADVQAALAPESGIMIPRRAQEGWQEFTRIAGAMLSGDASPAAMIRTVALSSYRDLLEREYPNWRERLEDLEQLALFAESTPDLAGFLSDLALSDEVAAARTGSKMVSPEEERVVLSTIHQAKGLEWETVFVIHLSEGAFPSRRALDEDGGLEEERRLFYVAVTRAQRRLFLTYPLTLGYDAFTLNQLSTFIEEIPPRLLERVELRSVRRPSSIHRWGGGDRTWEEPSIEIDPFEEKKTATRMRPKGTTMWKSSSSS